MSITFVKKLPSATEVKNDFPMTEELAAIKRERDAEIRKIFTGEDNRFIFIIGPCSADNETAVLDYLTRLAGVQEKIKDKILIIPRIYTGKPRTNGTGYKGILHQPDPLMDANMVEGLYALRKMHIHAIRETGMTAADEMLYTENWKYVDDILSYVAIGARSVEDQQHRFISSGMDVPVGMKNPTSGDFTVMMNSCVAGQNSQTFCYAGHQCTSSGNDLTHCILRGGLNKHGNSIPNYHYDDLMRLVENYQSFPNLKNPACIVDANHNNSGKKWDQQPRIVEEVLLSRQHSKDIHDMVKGVMVESYIEDGNQPVDGGCYGKSITDPCLGWVKTEKMLLEMADKII